MTAILISAGLVLLAAIVGPVLVVVLGLRRFSRLEEEFWREQP